MSRRHDVQDATGRIEYLAGRGTLRAWSSDTGANNTTTGVPINGVTGFAPGCIFQNLKGTAGSVLYVNVGTFASATWLNIA